MALFGRKKPAVEEGSDAKENRDKGDDSFQPDAEKARRWFDYAKTAAETSNFEYALTCYANGIKHDPEAMSAHEAMFEVGAKYANSGGKPASGKEIRGIEGSHPIAKFAAAEFAWMKDISNASVALKALSAAIKANQREYGNWAANRIFGVLRRSTKKVSKSTWLSAKDLFKEVGAWNEALASGQLALQLDPTDSELDHELKDISAQRAMDQGGYEDTAGEEGGFRKFIKDSQKQQELQESEAIAGGKTTEERNLLRAKAAYELTPQNPDVLNLYAQLVKKQGTPESEELAHTIYMKGFQDTNEYRFRMYAGDIKIEQLRRQVDSIDEALEKDPENESLKKKRLEQLTKVLDLEASEFAGRAAKYPTDRFMKVRLGEIEYDRGKYEEAMASLQAAKDEPKLRVRAGHMLGKCFAAEQWHMEAIGEYKEALAAIDVTEKDRELAIRYDLMTSLIEEARIEKSAAQAREALEICSSIARKNITYRDIRAKRKEVDQLIRELSSTESSG